MQVEVNVTVTDQANTIFVQVIGPGSITNNTDLIRGVVTTTYPFVGCSAFARSGRASGTYGRAIRISVDPATYHALWQNPNWLTSIERSIAAELEARATTLPKAG